MLNNVVLFDGVCNLCNGFVQFIIKHDSENKFKFCSLQSKQGQKIIAENNQDLENIDSVLFYCDNHLYYKSKAVFKIAKTIGFPLSMLLLFSFIPVKIRDSIYDFIAKNRYKWFGKQKDCWLPTSKLREKFIED